ncbi:MAG TPA: helicase C-terminal domain-containing protein [Phycisphaerales bacterium]|nr:helicase C-terminal domain-containing protein [Phycisphaerales bacterium]
MATLTDILSPAGPVAKLMGEDFEPRPEQLEMARAVEEAMEHRSHLLVEAGTGVGKSFAYLVPAVMRALLHGHTVVVATNTIALQEQLVAKDIPLLMKVLAELDAAGTPMVGADGVKRVLKPVLVKGRGNYVSLRRMRLAYERKDRMFSDPAARRSLEQIVSWSDTTKDGTLSTLPPIERMGVWDKVQSDSGNCMGRKCPSYDRCFYQEARRELEGANLLICNHALFFSDLALRSQEVGFLPAYQHVILDEAHNVEDVASDHFGVSLSEGRVNHLLATLHQARTGKGYLSNLFMVKDGDALGRCIGLVDKAHGVARGFFDDLLRLTEARDESGGGGGGGGWTHAEPNRSVRVREAGIVPNLLTQVMRELSLALKGLREGVKGEPDRYELNSYAQRAEMVAVAAEVLVSQQAKNYAYWVEVSGGDEDSLSANAGVGRGNTKRITFACSPIEVGPLLKERLFSQGCSVTLTSATLATRTVRGEETKERAETAFMHAMERLGCVGAKTLQLGSPFDYAKQVQFFVEGGRARGDEVVEEEWLPRGAAAERRGTQGRGTHSFRNPLSTPILKHIQATEGGAFVLFTSFATLNSVARDLAGVLAELGYPMLAQGRDGSRTLILQRFREDPRSVLLGAASFWQGVDVRGHGLRNVIITKLPFDPPDRPLTQARYELIESRGGNPFMEDSLPRAIIKFKQGFGRLIRSRSDRGRVVVLDARVFTARYGRLFLEALPEGVEVR